MFLVPVKPFKRAKSRVVEVFPPNVRLPMQDILGKALFDDTMDVLGSFMGRHAKGNVCTIVCSSDPAVEERVLQLGEHFSYIDETAGGAGGDGTRTLDHVIEKANRYAIEKLGAKGTILLMSDVPLLSVHSIVGLFKRLDGKSGSGQVILSPSMGNGCNMIARFPPDVIPTRYSSVHGPSFIEHLALAKIRAAEVGIAPGRFVKVYHNLDLYLDLDTPEDLMNLFPLLKEIRPGSHLSQALAGMDVRIEKRGLDDTRHVSIKIDLNGRC